MFKFKIVNADTEDYFFLENDSLEELQKEARTQILSRCWTNYFSVKEI